MIIEDVARACLAYKRTFRLSHIADDLGRSNRQVEPALAKLEKLGHIKKAAELINEPLYECLPSLKGATFEKPLKADPGRDAMWRALRVLRKTTARELAAISEQELKAAKGFVAALVKGGFARKVGKAQYMIAKDFGPSRPV